MVVYSIKDLENLSGIKAHTLRMWEKRYGIIKPKRTEANIRYYLDEDLKKVMNIAFLNRNGYKISKIACMDDNQIQSLAAKLSDVDESFENQLDGLTFSVLELNEDKFLKIFNANIAQVGFKDAMLNIIYPLLDKLNVMWMAGSVESIHEKFVSNLIKRKCIAEIDKTKEKNAVQTKFLLFLPPGESGELSLLFLHYLIRSQGLGVVNLGNDIDMENVISASSICSPQYILTIIDELSSKISFSNYVRLLSQQLGDYAIILTGLQIFKQQIKYPENVKTFESSEEILEFLKNIPMN